MYLFSILRLKKRTPPLWGIELTNRTNLKAGFLYDSRARTFLEASLWHGGEAVNAAKPEQQILPEARAARIQFIGSV